MYSAHLGEHFAEVVQTVSTFLWRCLLQAQSKSMLPVTGEAGPSFSEDERLSLGVAALVASPMEPLASSRYLRRSGPSGPFCWIRVSSKRRKLVLQEPLGEASQLTAFLLLPVVVVVVDRIRPSLGYRVAVLRGGDVGLQACLP